MDIGKNSFLSLTLRSVGASEMRQKWSVGQARIAKLQPCLLGMETEFFYCITPA
jgi:hypothetical protein